MNKQLILGIVFVLSSCLPVLGALDIHFDSVRIDNNTEMEPDFFRKTNDLQLNITSNTDLFEFSQIKRLPIIRGRFYLCDRDNNPLVGKEFNIYTNPQPLKELPLSSKTPFLKEVPLYVLTKPIDNKPSISPLLHQPAPYTYIVYFPNLNIFEDKQKNLGYNLWRIQEDLCFSIRAATYYSPFGITSNTVRIPKEAIKAAVDDYRKAHPDFVPPEEP